LPPWPAAGHDLPRNCHDLVVPEPRERAYQQKFRENKMSKPPIYSVAGVLFALAGLAALQSTPAAAGVGDFVGNWVNVDRDTSGITRVEVTRRGPAGLDIHIFGQCEPRDCDWGTVRGNAFSPSADSNPVRDATTVSATFNAGFAQKFIILHEARGETLTFEVYTNFTDRSRRSDYVMQGRLRPARGGGRFGGGRFEREPGPGGRGGDADSDRGRDREFPGRP
jgi:hypothetical protein